MKTTYLLIIALLFSTLFTACKKDYNCHCTYKTNGSVAYEQDIKIVSKKKHAAANCDENEFSKYETIEDSTYLSTAECTVIVPK